MAETKKTNNSYLSDKVALRLAHLPALGKNTKKLRVLDCYAGKGLIWKAVKQMSGRDITTLGIDVNSDTGFRLPGDNRVYLDTLDLTPFQIIDLDAYGVPYEQLKTLFRREYRGYVFVTFTQPMYGHQMPIGLLEDIGFTHEMIKASPSLSGELGWQYFTEWLALQGVKKIFSRSHARKHYLFFEM